LERGYDWLALQFQTSGREQFSIGRFVSGFDERLFYVDHFSFLSTLQKKSGNVFRLGIFRGDLDGF